MTFAAVDLLMSLNPHWVSTIFGVYFFAGSVLSGLIVLTPCRCGSRPTAGSRGPITAEHYHDLGKLTFAFVILLGLYRLQPIPADLVREHAGGDAVLHASADRSLGRHLDRACLCHLLIPFSGLLSRHAKRRPMVLRFGPSGCWPPMCWTCSG